MVILGYFSAPKLTVVYREAGMSTHSVDCKRVGTPRIRAVRDQVCTTQGPQVNCVEAS